MSNKDPRDRPPIPTIDILIMRRFLDEPEQFPQLLSRELGEHESNVRSWCEKFVKLGILTRSTVAYDKLPTVVRAYTAFEKRRVQKYIRMRVQKKDI